MSGSCHNNPLISGLSGHIWHMTLALTLSASEHADVRPVSYDVRHTNGDNTESTDSRFLVGLCMHARYTNAI